MPKKIIEADIDTVVVSLDSASPSKHDYNRGRPGTFNAAIQGIKELKKKRKKKPIIKSTTIFSKQTYPQIKQTIDYLSQIVDEYNIQPIVTGYTNHPHQIDKNQKKSFIPQTEEESQLIESLRKLKQAYPSFNNFYLNNIPTYLFHPKKLLKIKCWSPFLRLQILPQGAVTHCPANPKYSSTVGNLKNMSLMEAWNSPIIKKHREEIRKHKNNCICWSRDSSFNASLYAFPLMNKLPVLKRRIKHPS